jgi:Uma2 family endonuclease
LFVAATLFDQLASGQAPPHVPLTVAQAHEMLEAGWLADGEPVELVEGVLVRKDRSALGESRMTHGKRHSSAVAMLRRLDRLLDERGCHLRSQLPVTLSATSELEPDGAIVCGRDDGYLDHHPGAGEVLVAIEVSDSSLLFDRGTKLRLYAAASIPVYVIVNLGERQVEVYGEPEASSGRYRARRDFAGGEIIELPLPSGSVSAPCSDFLPD